MFHLIPGNFQIQKNCLSFHLIDHKPKKQLNFSKFNFFFVEFFFLIHLKNLQFIFDILIEFSFCLKKIDFLSDLGVYGNI